MLTTFLLRAFFKRNKQQKVYDHSLIDSRRIFRLIHAWSRTEKEFSVLLIVKTINFSGSLAHLPNLLGCYLKKRYLFVCFCLSNSYVCLWNLISLKIVFFFSRTLIWLHLQHPDLKMMMISLMTKSWIKQVQLLLLFQMTNLSIFNVPPSMNPVRIF